MKVIIHGKNIRLTPAIRFFVNENIKALIKLIPDSENGLAEARVEVGKPSLHHREGKVFYAEVNLKIGRKLMRANEKHFDLYTAIRKARDEIKIQIKKFKGKILVARKKPPETL